MAFFRELLIVTSIYTEKHTWENIKSSRKKAIG